MASKPHTPAIIHDIFKRQMMKKMLSREDAKILNEDFADIKEVFEKCNNGFMTVNEAREMMRGKRNELDFWRTLVNKTEETVDALASRVNVIKESVKVDHINFTECTNPDCKCKRVHKFCPRCGKVKEQSPEIIESRQINVLAIVVLVPIVLNVVVVIFRFLKVGGFYVPSVFYPIALSVLVFLIFIFKMRRK